MTRYRALLRGRPAAQRFFLAHAQSSLGTGLGYVALVLVALQRFHGSWAVAGLLIADLVPMMLLGPLLGAAADRWPRRRVAVAADLMRALAFAGIAVTGDLSAALALAALAGVGNALFNPAILAGLPDLADAEHVSAATSLFGLLSTLGKTLGPALGASLMLVFAVQTTLFVNAGSFVLSALLLLKVDLGTAARGHTNCDDEFSPVRGVSPLRRVPGFRVMVGAASSVSLFAAMSNVAEPSLVTRVFDAAPAAFSALVAVYGVGVAVGSAQGARGGAVGALRARYALGIAGVGVGFAVAGLAPAYGLALAGFAVAGWGNGLTIVHERLLVQAVVPQVAMGRAFGTLDMAASWAFAAALGLGAILVSTHGARTALAVAGAGTLATSFVVGAAWRATRAPLLASAPT